MSREIQEDNISKEVECEFEIFQFEAFNVVSDYIQSPEVLVGISIDNLMEATRDQIKNASRIEEPPFLSGTYGPIRKEAYAKFSKIIEHFSGNKRRQYKKTFYQEFDIKNEQLFNNSMPIEEYYRDEIYQQRNKTSPKKSRREYDLSDADLTSQFLSAEVDKLVLKWHILVDQTLNELLRCELYELKNEAAFRVLFENSSAQLKKKQGSSWTDWFSDGFTFLKNMFGSSNQKQIEKEGTGIDFKEFYELTMTMCCEDIVSGYCNNFDHHYNERVLIKMKGFMILLTENIEAYNQTLSRSVDKLLMDEESLEKAQKSLDDIFEQLKIMEKNMTDFDQGFLKDYFKEEIKEASTGATHPSDETSQVAADFLKQ